MPEDVQGSSRGTNSRGNSTPTKAVATAQRWSVVNQSGRRIKKRHPFPGHHVGVTTALVTSFSWICLRSLGNYCICFRPTDQTTGRFNPPVFELPLNFPSFKSPKSKRKLTLTDIAKGAFWIYSYLSGPCVAPCWSRFSGCSWAHRKTKLCSLNYNALLSGSPPYIDLLPSPWKLSVLSFAEKNNIAWSRKRLMSGPNVFRNVFCLMFSLKTVRAFKKFSPIHLLYWMKFVWISSTFNL